MRLDSRQRARYVSELESENLHFYILRATSTVSSSSIGCTLIIISLSALKTFIKPAANVMARLSSPVPGDLESAFTAKPRSGACI